MGELEWKNSFQSCWILAAKFFFKTLCLSDLLSFFNLEKCLWAVIIQVLAYAQQSRECSNYEQASLNERMHEYMRQIDQESRQSINGGNCSPNGDRVRPFAKSSHKVIEAVMQSAAKGKVSLK